MSKAPYHILPSFRVRLAKRSTHDHWQGGKAYHQGAVCPLCDRPLLLLWDFNCSDPRFIVKGSRVFGNLERLPLYYCWTCCAEMDYRVTAKNHIQVLSNKGKYEGDEFPYKHFPLQFKRQPIELDKLGDLTKQQIKQLCLSWVDVPSGEAKNFLEKWLGRKVKSGFDIWWHQLGGIPWLVQGQEDIVCPNEECSWGRRGRRMKVLACILNDPPSGLPMIETMRDVKKNKGHFNNYSQIVFHICKGCQTIHSGNRCD